MASSDGFDIAGTSCGASAFGSDAVAPRPLFAPPDCCAGPDFAVFSPPLPDEILGNATVFDSSVPEPFSFAAAFGAFDPGAAARAASATP
ncbi:hypothetical protein [Nocardia cerradoensis]|uniref:hypothetical protein n=1 Tax=Nocardia cerradoensis TaxID=85688 RepID=UPI0014443041|nr:hypothetical protein [Nocardia cerradoensis]NKY46752.1 hypothetical protein [Nocardia cerradoensis]